MTPAILGDIIGYQNPGRIYDFLSGKKDLKRASFLTVHKIADALGVGTADLFDPGELENAEPKEAAEMEKALAAVRELKKKAGGEAMFEKDGEVFLFSFPADGTARIRRGGRTYEIRNTKSGPRTYSSGYAVPPGYFREKVGEIIGDSGIMDK